VFSCAAEAVTRFYWIMLATAIATTMAGQALLKAGAGVPNFVAQLFDPRTLAGLVLYGGAAVLYIVALRRIPLSVALPCTAVSYIAAALIGHYVFAEPLGLTRIGGIGLICAGVVLLAVG
jgi:small multidrug resistance pump